MPFEHDLETQKPGGLREWWPIVFLYFTAHSGYLVIKSIIRERPLWMVAFFAIGLAFHLVLQFWILRVWIILRKRGYDWIGWRHAAIITVAAWGKVRRLPPAEEFLALPGAERDTDSIVRVLLGRN